MAATVTRESIADAGIAVLDRDGLDALSMRKVASELGVQAASLYWHVRNKEELLELVADALFRDVVMPEVEGGWREQLRAMATTYRQFLKSRRDAARLLGGRFVVGPHATRAIEATLRLFRDAGFPLPDAAHAMFLVTVYVQGFVLQETVPMSAAEALGASPAEAMEGIARRLDALPADEFPALAEGRRLLTMMNIDGRFAFGVERILDGLATRLPPTAPE